MRKPKARPPQRPRLLAEELEPRILYSADAAALLGLNSGPGAALVREIEPSALPGRLAEVQQPTAAHDESQGAREIVFIDSRVPDAMRLADELMRQRGGDHAFDIVVLDADEDGIAQINRILAHEQDLAAIHIISHGGAGSVEIGSTRLDAARLAVDAESVARWGQALGADGDLLLYGCDVAQDAAGRAFVQSLASLTGADVAASDDKTGSVSIGGNWTLEFETGAIEAMGAVGQQHQQDWSAVLALTPQGGETRVNSGTTGNQLTTPFGGGSVAMDSAGNYVIVYTDMNVNSGNVYAQRYNASGAAQGAAILVNGTTANEQSEASVAMAADGRFVVSWSSNGQDTSGWGVYARRFAADGTAAAAEFRVNTNVTGSQRYSKVGMDAAGNFVVTFADYNADSGDVYAQRYNAAGVAQGANFRVNSTVANEQSYPDIDVHASSGDFIIVWESLLQDGSDDGVYGLRYNAAGVAQGGEFQLHANTADMQESAKVAYAPDGSFAVAWESGASNIDFIVRRFDASGNALTGDITAHTTTADTQRWGDLAFNDNGNLIVTWGSDLQDGSGSGVYAQQFDATTGAKVGAELRVSTSTTNAQRYPSIAASGSKAVIVWDGNGTVAGNTDSAGVFMQRLNVSGITVTPVTGLLTTEAGGSAQFNVVLLSAPTANVTIAVNSSDLTEGTVSTSLLTFTTGNWSTPQTVTVTGVNDALADAYQRYSIVLGPASSSDGNYSGLTPAGVAVSNRDDDLNYGLIEVTTTSDSADGDTSSLTALDTNRGADGQVSLREAVIAANNTANGAGGADRIHFNIAGTGVHTIAPTAALPTITGQVVIDASTDDSFAANGNRPAIILEGTNAGAGTDGLVLTSTADGSVIRGLVIRDFGNDGIVIQAGSDNNVIAGNYIGRLTATGTDAGAGTENADDGIEVLGSNNTIGGTVAADRNVISGNASTGINLEDASGNTVAGNYIGLTAAGTAVLGNGNDGVLIRNGASGNTIGGATPAHRNVIAGNNDGVQIGGTGVGANDNNVVIGNYIGTDVTGTIDFGNLDDGVDIDDASLNNQILNNLIAGNTSDGIDLAGAGTPTGTVIQGNLIGTAANGSSPLGNSGHGIRIGTSGTAYSTTIGGTAGGQGNTIAFNARDGIFVDVTSTSVAILGNSIYGNTEQGVDLGAGGVTANDAGDGDTGANNLQNFPVLASANTNAAGTTIVGMINSNANTSLRIEFFANRPSIADALNGEGERFLGFITVTTDGSGNASVNTTLANVWVNSGDRISATATNLTTNDTSEFAANVTATSIGIIVVDTTSDVSDGTTTSIINLGNARGADGRISLREAIIAANATANGGTPDRIVFNIPRTDANHLYYRDNAAAGTFSAAVATTGADSAITDFDADYVTGTARSWYRITLGTTSLDATQAVIIDGSTQAGYDPAKGPVIEINAAAVTGADANAIALTTGGSTIRGLVINRAGDNAIEIDVGATSSVIVGNYFGTDVSGTQALGNSTVGSWGAIAIKANNVVVGGTTAADRNLISGNLGYGIEFYSSASNAVVQGNYIGTTVTGSGSLGNSAAGVYIRNGAANNTIGGTGANEGNLIANNGGDGIWADATAGTGNRILLNTIYSNAGLGVDLGANGVTANDVGDADTGANNLQNFPVLTAAATTGAQVSFTGTLNSTASTQFRIEFFASNAQDGTGYGEGQRYLGSADVTTDTSGNATISATLTATVAAGEFISATATRSNPGFTVFTDTSEFAQNVTSVVTVNNAPTFFAGDGKLTTDFGFGSDTVTRMAVQADGKIVVVGAAFNGTDTDFAVARYNTDGTLDATFGTGGKVTTSLFAGNESGNAVAIQADGKILVAGTAVNAGNSDFALIRYNTNGTLDTTFDTDGKLSTAVGTGYDDATSIAVQSDGKILVAGLATVGANYDFAVVRYNTNGTLDTSFDTDGKLTTAVGTANDFINSIGVQSDGKIVVAGFATVSGSIDFALARYNTNGSLDTSFDTDGKVTTAVLASTDIAYGLAIQSDGKILVAGSSNNGSNSDFALVRYNTNGSLDTSFDTDGKLTTAIGTGNDDIRSIALQSDGKILAAGSSSNGSDFDIALARYNTNGSLDTGLDTDGKLTTAIGSSDDFGRSVVVQTDGKILVAGYALAGATNDFALLRYNADGSLDTRFDLANTLDGTPAYAENGASVLLDNNVQVFDAELSAANNFNGATLTLARNGGASAQDLFSATGNLATLTQGGNVVLSGVTIGTVSTNSAGTLLLTFNASATQARVNETLQSIAYANSSDAPPASVQINWTFNDGNSGAQGSGGAASASGSTTVTVTAVNDAPVNTVPSGQYTPFNAPLVFSSANGNAIIIADADAAANPVQVTLTVGNGTLTLAGTAGLTITGGANGSATMTFTGSVGSINTALDGLSYSATANYRGLDTLQIATSDLGNTGAGGTLTDTDSVKVYAGALVVTNTSDTSNGTTTSIGSLVANDGGDGISLREAIIAANNTAGADTIRFDIAGTGVHTIAPTAALPTITGQVTIDASTDDSFAANGNRPAIILDGNDLAAPGLELSSTADGSTIRGFVIRDFAGDGIAINAGSDGNTIAGNYIGSLLADGSTAGGAEGNNDAGIYVEGANNTIGGLTAADRNVISGNVGAGVRLDGASGNTIAGNYIGTNAAGTNDLGNGLRGIYANNSASNQIGGTTAAARNVIAGNTGSGIYINGATSTGNAIQGNFIGTTAAGNVALGNQSEGITLDRAVGTLIGGTSAGAGNVIGNSNWEGIWIIRGATDAVIQGNWIGTDVTGTVDLGNNTGIGIGNTGTPASGNLIGGTAAGAGNVIAFNSDAGIAIDTSTLGASVGNAILGNTIYSNDGSGIDLDSAASDSADPGVTANDAGDGDSGANNRQNFPVLVSAYSSGGDTTIVGSLNSTANTTLRIEFFSAAAGDGSGHGEGQVFLGSTSVTTDGSGNASINAVLTGVTVTAGHVVSATATVDLGGGNYGSTSEFAANVVATNIGAGITVSAISGSTSEAGASATFSVSLDTAPTANVTIAVSSSNTLEGTVSTSLLTFTSANWNVAQTVTVTGVDDNRVDGNATFSALLAPATSSDGSYGGLDAPDVAVTNVDNDSASITVTPVAVSALGGETLVNTNTANIQSIMPNVMQAVAVDANGNYVVVWASELQDGALYGIYAQRFNADGTALGAEFQVNTTTADTQILPGVAMDAAGNFSVAWASNLQDGSGFGIYAQRYNAAGLAQGGEFLVNTTTAASQSGPSIAMSATGAFVIAWTGSGQDPDASSGIYAQRFDAGGVAQGGEFRVNTYTTNIQQLPSVAMDASGNFVVTWVSNLQDGSGYGVYGQRYNAGGVAQGAEFRVNTTTADSQLYHDVAMLEDGRFVVAYQGRTGANYEVYIQRYAANGVAIGGETRVNTTTVASYQPIPSISADAGGNLTVVWNSPADGGFVGVVGRQLDWSGAAIGGEFQVNTTTAGDQLYPEVVAQPGGRFLVAWAGNGAGDAYGIFTQRYGLVTTEAGGSASFSVVLEAAPTDDVVISVSVPDGTEGTVSVASLVFTTANWNIAQTVTVTGVQDFSNDGDAAFTVVLGAATSSDLNFSGLNPADLSVVNREVANVAPVNTVPAAQTVNEDTALVFSSANGNAITVSDADAGTTNAMQVTLSVTNGMLTLSGVAGLSFASGANGSATMTFTGTIASINTALDGLRFDPTAGFNGAASLQIVTNDLGNTGTGGALSDTNIVAITVSPVNDAPTGAPVVTGTPTEDQVLTASTGTIADGDGLGAVGYQWQRNGVNIGGATGSTYTLDDADVGANIRVVVSYTDGQGTAESLISAAVGPIANVNDVPTGAPAVTGTPTEDQVLGVNTSSIADADGLGSFSYQWQRNGANIGGATASTYTLGDADVGSNIRVVVSYTDARATAESLTSAAVGPIANINDAPSGSVTIDDTTPTQGQPLTASNSLTDLDGLGAISYQWQRGGVDIAGATGSTYTTTQSDVGSVLRVVAGYTDAQGTAESVASAASAAVANVNDAPTGSVTIDDTTPTQGQTLTASNTLADLDGVGAISYQWQRGGVDIAGATGATYTTTQSDVGSALRVVASYTDALGTAESVASANTVAVINVNDTPTGSVTIDDTTPTQGQTLTASNTLADLDGLGTITYQWQRGGVDIAGATGSTYTTTQSDSGSVLRVVAGYTDGQGTAESMASADTSTVANINDAPVGVPTITGTVSEDQTLSANTTGITDADGLGTFSYEWLRNGATIGGANASTYTLGDADVGTLISVRVSYTDAQGTAEGPLTSAQTAAVANVNDAPTGGVTIDDTTPAQGQTLAASNTLADLDGLGTIAYQWQRGGVDIAGATGATYTTTQSDVGSALRVVASYTDGQGTAESVVSSNTAAVTNVNDAPAGSVTIDDTTPTQGQMLTASNTLADADGLGAISHQWQRGGVDIAGATGASYTTTQSDVGSVLRVIASYTDALGTAESVASADTSTVANVNDAPTGSVTIDDTTPTQGQTLTASNTLADLDGLGTIAYQWQRGGVNIAGATGSTYTTTQSDVGSVLRVIASYTDALGTAESVASADTSTVANVNDAPVAADDRPALNFDGVDDYVTIADSASLVMNSTMTLEAWINPDLSSNAVQIIANKEGEYELGVFADGSLQFAFAEGGTWNWHDTGATIVRNTWTHVAVTYDAGTVTTYVNGVAVNSQTLATNTIDDVYPALNELRIGGRSNNPANQFFEGRIADVRVWDVVRSPGQIAGAMNSPLTGAEVGLAGYWALDENSGTTVADKTANGNTGTLVNGVTWAGYRIAEDSTLTALLPGVLANDYDADGNPLTAILVSGPAHGSLTLNADGSFIYTPTAHWSGTDSFTYKANDGTADSNTATVSVVVDPVNDAPSASNLSAAETYTEDTALNLTGIVISDVDSTDVTATLTLSNAAAGSLNTGTSGGVTSTYDAGTGVWTASGAIADVNALLAGLSFTPAADFNSAFTIATSVSDGSLGVSGTKVLTGSAVNDAPSATIAPATYAATEQVALTLKNTGLAISDVDAAAGAMTVTLSVTEGTLTVSAGGSGALVSNSGTSSVTITGTVTQINNLLSTDATSTVSYADNTDAPSASAALSLQVNDNGNTGGGSLTNSDTATINITAVNDAPVLAAIGNQSVNEGATLSFTASATDADLPAQSLNYTLDAASLALGMTIDSSTGVFSWAPSEAQGGLTPSVTITVTDNGTGSLTDSETFTISVGEVNTAPVLAAIGNQSVNEGSTLSFTASATDADVPSQTLTYSLDAASLALGMTINSSTGVFSWTPSEAQGGLAPSVTITVTDNGTGNLTDSETFTINVSDTNLTPVLGAIGNQSVNEGATLSFTASATDTDLPAQSLSYSLDAASLALGMSIDSSTGAFSWTPSEAQGGLAPSVTITVTDNGAGNLTDSETFTITVGDINVAPVLAAVGNQTANEGATLSFTASTTDADLPSQTLTYSLDAASLALGMSINSSTGAFSWTPSEAQGGLAPSVTITVTDNGTGSLTDSETFTITVGDINVAPVLAAVGNQTVNEGATLSFTASTTDADLPSQTLTYSLDAASLALGMSINSSTGAFSWTPSEAQGGLAPSVSVSVTDNGSGNLTDSETFTITVSDTNLAPVLAAIGNKTVNEGATLSFTAGAADADLPAQSLSYSLDAASIALGMTIDASTGVFSWTPSEAQGGLAPSVTITVTDNGAGNLTDSETFTITVGDTNLAPVLAAIGNQAVNEGATLSFTASAADADLPSQTLTYSLDAASLALGMSINGSTGAFSWTPSEAQGGLAPSVTITVTDNGTGNLADSETFTISVGDTNLAPVLAAIGNQSVNEGATLSFNASAADPDLPAQTLSYSLDAASLALGMSINASTGVFSWIPSEAQGGLVPSVTVTVTDNGSGNLTDSETFTITVGDTNLAPVLAAIGNQTVNEGATLSLTASAADADLPSQTLTYSLDAASLALGMTINSSTGAFSWTPSEAQGGLAPSVTITVTDNGSGNLTDTETFTITVGDTNLAPVLAAIGNQTVNEGATLSFTASAADADLPSQTLSYSLDAASLALGMTINASTGAFSWTPSEAQGGLAPAVTVTVTDNGTGNLTDSETFTISVGDTNLAPVLAAIGNQSVNEGATLSFTASATDADLPAQSLSYSLDAASLALGMSINASTGVFSWTPSEAQGGLAPSVTVTVTDNGTGNLTDSETFTITVGDTNVAPVLAAIGNQSVNEGATLSFTASATDADLPAQSLSYSLDAASLALGMTINVGTGAFSWTPSEAQGGLAPSVTVTVTDNGSGNLTDSETFTITVGDTNLAPVLAAIGNQTVNEGATLSLTASAADADLPTQGLTYSLDAASLALGMTIDNSTGVFSWTPSEAQGGLTPSVTVTVTDNGTGNLTDSETFTITVGDTNLAPVLAPIGNQSVNEGATLSFSASAVDPDLPSQTLTYSLDAASLALGMSINSSTGVFSWTPSEAQGGLAPSVTVTVTDNGTGNLIDSETFTISVGDTNLAPVLAAIGNQSVNEGATLSFNASATDADLPAQSLSYSLDAASLALGMSIDSSTGAFSWTPSEAQGGLTPSVTITVTDNGTGNLTDSETFTITVGDTNLAPVLAPIGNQSVNEGATLSFSASAVDPDLPSQTMTYSLDAASLALGMSINSSTGVFSWTPSEAQGGLTPSVTITVTDNGTGNLFDSETVTISVAAVNDAPVAAPVTLSAIDEDSGARLITQAELLFSATDIDGPSLSAAGLAIASGSGSLVDNGNGTWTYAPALNDDTSVSFAYTVTDGSLTAGGNATLDITPVNDAPTLTAAPLTLSGGQGVLLDPAQLSVDDPDSAAASLSFTVRDVRNGRFEWAATPGVPISQFTQADVAAGRVRFVSTSSTDAPTFRVLAFDGQAYSAEISAAVAFNPTGLPPADDPASNPPAATPGATGSPDVALPAAPGPAPAPTDSAIRLAAQSPTTGGGGEPTDEPLGRFEVAAPRSVSVAPEVERPRSSGNSGDLVLKLTTTADDYFIGTLQIQALNVSLQDQPSLRAGPPSDEPVAMAQASEEKSGKLTLSETTQITGLALTAGTVWWALRAGGLLSGLLVSLPAWRHADLLAVLPDEEDEDAWDLDEDDEAERDEHAVGTLFEPDLQGDLR